MTTQIQRTPAQQADAAAEAIRSLNHLTKGTGEDWQYPGDAYDAVGNLATMAQRLPQALEQIGRMIERLAAQDHIRSDKGGDGSGDVTAALIGLRAAKRDADALGSHLNAVHSALSPLAWRE
jgi:hypothetical protein